MKTSFSESPPLYQYIKHLGGLLTTAAGGFFGRMHQSSGSGLFWLSRIQARKPFFFFSVAEDSLHECFIDLGGRGSKERIHQNDYIKRTDQQRGFDVVYGYIRGVST